MVKVHITLVGGQRTPVYNGIVATCPDKVVFIYSDSTKSDVEALRKVVTCEIEEQPPLDPTNPTLIEERAKSLADRYANDEVTLNISGGLKSWSHLFARVFDPMPNVTVIYIDQNNKLWNYRTMSEQMTVGFDMDAHFRMLGNPLEHYTPFAQYTDEDKASMETLIAARRYNCGSFNKLTTILSKEWENRLNQKTGELSLSEDEYIAWEKPDFVRMSLNTRKHGIQEFQIESPNAVAMAFHAGWFEYKIARMVSHWRYAKEIRMNCLFPPQNTKAGQFPKNEIDLIVNTGAKILFVECKTQINQSTDIDKFRTAVKNYGGMGSKALFVTDNVMTDMQKEKCHESGIIIFSLQDASTGPNKEQALFALLGKELFNINTK